MTLEPVIARMSGLLDHLELAGDERRHFLATYRRITISVEEDLGRGGFADVDWVQRWDVAFAGFYLDALESSTRGDRPPLPWAVAFEAAEDHDVPPLRHVLLGMNAHINYDLPQALLASISSADFDDADVLERRRRDHERVDALLAGRVKEEDEELKLVEEPGDRTVLDRLLTPFNQQGTKRFMREARRKVWYNAVDLDAARRRGQAAYEQTLGELERLAGERVADLRRPGPVLLRLAIGGFGVQLPAPAVVGP